MGYRIGIDVGGTFTDFVAVNTDQQMYSGKTPTIATDEAASVFGGLEQIAAHFGISLQTLLAETDPIVLGTTVVTNTMLEFAGANIGLITTNIQNYEEYFAVRREYFTKFNPASTGVQVAALAFEDLLLEVEAIAYLPDEA